MKNTEMLHNAPLVCEAMPKLTETEADNSRSFFHSFAQSQLVALLFSLLANYIDSGCSPRFCNSVLEKYRQACLALVSSIHIPVKTAIVKRATWNNHCMGRKRAKDGVP